MKLTELRSGQKAKIQSIGGDSRYLSRITSIGLNVGYDDCIKQGRKNLVFGLIEEVGYMARVSYVFDNTMSKLGLQGKSIMPMFIGVGCTIGGAAGTRVIDSWGQKILTIALVWAVPCGATFAVIPTLAGAFFGWGSILVMILLFAIMFLHIQITARIFGKKLSPVEERTGLIMELPPYHKVRWGALLRQTLNRVWGIFKKAFAVVVVVAAVFWALSYSSTGVASDSILYKKEKL